ncbi:MAG: transporter [Candidatus Eremiobacteraeota bacterium]|nr:transporter [Candidatus Eremiobacteraeota bacterium]
MVPGIIIILIFLIIAWFMVTRRMPALLALPVMALSIGLVAGLAAGLPWMRKPEEGQCLFNFLFNDILTTGSARLAQAMLYAIFGSILSQVVMRQGIAQRIVKIAAEFAGDRKMLIAFVMTAAISVAFLSLTGLGAVIMLGSLALPILIGGGLSPVFSASIFLFAISLGGVFNGANMGFYTDVLKLDLATVRSCAGAYGILLGLVTVAFLIIEGRKDTERFTWSFTAAEPGKKTPWYALLTPVIPIALIMLPSLHWPIIPSFLTAILYGCITTEPGRIIQNLTACVMEGLKDIAPVFGLFIGIGMTLAAMMDPVTTQIMDPFIKAVIPRTPLLYIIIFTIFAPLSLYRGPLNLYGLGAGFAALVLGARMLSSEAVMAAFLAVGQIQGICDPTNTHNVWIAQFTKLSPEEFLKKTLPYVWVFVFLALVYSVLVKHVVL